MSRYNISLLFIFADILGLLLFLEPDLSNLGLLSYQVIVNTMILLAIWNTAEHSKNNWRD